MDYEALQRIMTQVQALARTPGWNKDRIDSYLNERYSIPNVAALTQLHHQALQENASTDEQADAVTNALPQPGFGERGLLSETLPAQMVQRFGHDASFGWTDKLAGLYDAIDAIQKGGDPTSAYTAGKGEAQQYTQEADAANPTLNRVAGLAGTLASSIPAFETGVAGGAKLPLVGGTGLAKSALRAGITGGALDATAQLAGDEPFSLAHVLKSGAMAATGEGALRMAQNAVNPAAWRFERAIEASPGGEAGIVARSDAMAQNGARPMLAETSAVMRQEALKFIPRASAQALDDAAASVRGELNRLKTARKSLTEGPLGFQSIDTPVAPTPRVRLLATDPTVSPIIAKAVRDGRVPSANLDEWTATDYNYIRRQLDSAARSNFATSRNESLGAAQRQAETVLDTYLKNSWPGYTDLQSRLASSYARETQLQQMLQRIEGSAGASRGRVRPTVGAGPHHQLVEEMGLDKFERDQRAANTMVRLMFDPTVSAEEALGRIRALRNRVALKPHEGLFGEGGLQIPSAVAPALGQNVPSIVNLIRGQSTLPQSEPQ